MEYLEKIIMSELLNTKGLNTVLVIALIIFLKSIFTRMVLGSKVVKEEKRKWVIRIRNWATVFAAISVVVIWSTEIQTFALSLAALALAIAVSIKELTMCFMGGVVRSFQQPFKVGDRIEVDGIRGDVIDTDLFITKIMEIGPHNLTHQYTGRAVSIPNSLFLTHKIINESFMHKYVLHVFVVPLSRSDDWKKAEQVMLEAADKECAPFLVEAKNSLSHRAHKEGLEFPSVEPRVRFHLSANSEMEMIVRIPAPATKKGNIEQYILRRFMEGYLGHG